ncbi:hypothetical protein FHT43_006100 [Mycolicibacterium sp. BK607]|nr:hypothetical protein [Mycolicibacterium sp. BK607]MBB3636161.1 hypothetical protein [Mycolicibacterium sp. BK607]
MLSSLDRHAAHLGAHLPARNIGGNWPANAVYLRLSGLSHVVIR